MQDRQHFLDPFGFNDRAIGRVSVEGGSILLWLLVHTSEESYFGSEDLVPLIQVTGHRTYVHARLCARSTADEPVGEGAPQPVGNAGHSSRSSGERHIARPEFGSAQAWYYPVDHLLVLWECFLFDPVRQSDPRIDELFGILWSEFEQRLLVLFPAARRIATPSGENLYDRSDWHEFLLRHGYRMSNKDVFLKDLQEREL